MKNQEGHSDPLFLCAFLKITVGLKQKHVSYFILIYFLVTKHIYL